MSQWLKRLQDIEARKNNENVQSSNCQNRQNSANNSSGSFGSNELAENKNNSGSGHGSGSSKPKQIIFDLWRPVRHLKYLDRDFLSGFIAAKQFDNYERNEFLREYAKKWKKGADRQSVEHRKDNAGRKAANTWLLRGGK